MGLSIIMPCYKGEKFIEKSIHIVEKEVSKFFNDFEVIVVIDGFVDNSYKIAKNLENLYDNLKVIGYKKNRGKGYALKSGFENSKMDLIAFMDTDLDLHPKQIKKVVEIMEKEKADVVVGSKRHPESKINYPFKRRILSDGYFLMVKILFNLNVKDTQVGLKLFKRKVLRDVMPRILVKRYAFDVEVLANAVRKGYKIVEAPVELDLKHSSNINWKEIWRMFVDTLAIAYRMHIRRYYD